MHRTARRTYPAKRTVTGPRANQFAGQCSACGENVPAGAGLLEGSPRNWTVKHRPATWSGSPVSGWYINGCPADTARQNAQGGWGPASARTYVPPARAGNAQADYAGPEFHDCTRQVGRDIGPRGRFAPAQADPSDAREASRLAGGKYACTSSGACMTLSSQRCIDAPCCGCCD